MTSDSSPASSLSLYEGMAEVLTKARTVLDIKEDADKKEDGYREKAE